MPWTNSQLRDMSACLNKTSSPIPLLLNTHTLLSPSVNSLPVQMNSANARISVTNVGAPKMDQR